MASVKTVPMSKLPETIVAAHYVTLSDHYPDDSGQKIAFTFPECVTADPLTAYGPAGSEPNGAAAWWPLFQQRNCGHQLTWVQGHMLNALLHGKGTPDNLIPITYKVNSNMCARVENLVKAMAGSPYVFRYEVRAFWDLEPRTIRKQRGIVGIDRNGELYWGEQFAPSRISMKVEVYPDWLGNRSSKKLIDPILHGEEVFYNVSPV